MNNNNSTQSIISNIPETHKPPLWIMPIELEKIDDNSLNATNDSDFKNRLIHLFTNSQVYLNDRNQDDELSLETKSESKSQEILVEQDNKDDNKRDNSNSENQITNIPLNESSVQSTKSRLVKFFRNKDKSNPKSNKKEDILDNRKNSIENLSMTNETALEKFGSIFGPESKLIYTNKSFLKAEEKSINDSADHSKQKIDLDPVELDQKKRNKVDEYCGLEKKQSSLINLLANKILSKFVEENKRQNLCDESDIIKVFSIVTELEQFRSKVHDEVSELVLKRLSNEWNDKPYFCDIIIKLNPFYKIYKPTLSRYPAVQANLTNLMKKRNVSMTLQKILEGEAQQLENVNRIDILFGRLVDFPRRIIQLLQDYRKLFDLNSEEYERVNGVMNLYTGIFESSNQDLNQKFNFELCYEIQYFFEPPLLTIVDSNRQLIKQGPVLKVAKRDGNIHLRHLALFTDSLLICKCDRVKRKLVLNYRYEAKKIKLVENPNSLDDLIFRIISSDQNNEFKVDNLKEKEEWMKAFKKVDVFISTDEANYTLSIEELGEKPPIWIKDNYQNDCYDCRESFTTFKRRHHCRACGNIFCNNCCKLSVPLKYDDFKEVQRVCNSCFKIVNKKYQEYLSQNNAATPVQTSSNVLNQIIKNIIPSKSREFTNEISQNSSPEIKIDEIENKIDNFKLDSIDLNDLFCPSYQELSNKTARRSSSNTTSTNDSFSSCVEEEITKPKEEVQELITTPKPPVPPRPKLSTTSPSKLFLKREPMFHEYGYLNKIQIQKDLRTDLGENTSPSKSHNWERVCFVLYSDHTLGICPNHSDLNHPAPLIHLNLFNQKDVNDTTFGLDKIMDDLGDSIDEVESELTDKKPITRLGSRLKMFEFNFELRFQNKNIK